MTARRWLVGLTAIAVGCGYHLPGSGGGLPSGARTVSIALFANHTREHGLEVTLRRMIEEEFRRHGGLDLAAGREGDLLVSGVIRSYQTVAVGLSATGQALQFRGVMVVGFKVVERETGHLVYENRALQESIDFGAEASVVVTSSPRFQRGTIDAQDLATMTNAQLVESRRAESLRQLLDAVSRDVYLQSMEGF